MVLRGEPYPDLDLPFEPVDVLLPRYAARDAAKVALVDLDQGMQISWGALDTAANRIAAFLAGRGIGIGDKVGLLADETIEKLIVWLGVWRAGACVCPLNVELNANFIADMLNQVEPKLVLWHKDMDGPALTHGVDADAIRIDSWGDDQGASGSADSLFPMVASNDPAAAPDIAATGEDLSAIFCTSGTTARPKLIVHKHTGLWRSGLSTIDFLGLTEHDKTLEYRSFGWNSAQILTLLPWLQTGLTLHIAKRFSHSKFFDWIKAHRITFSAGVPTVVNMLLNEPTGITAKDIPSLRLMTCSTAPLTPEQWQRFEEMYGVTLLQLYGMSEAGWICGNRHYERRMGTVGKSARYQQFEIVDDDDNPVPPGTEGLVTVGGPQVCYGTISTDGDFEDWTGLRTRTGDLAVMDEDGFVRVTGRIKDIIIRGGANISPLEIDEVVMRHDSVQEAAAVGVPHHIYGEEVVCYVVPKPGSPLDVEALTQHCATDLPPFKMPKAFYQIDELPKSDRGKIVRARLKDKWEDEVGELA
jgi:acyl-coenzyme A synthetase/AMP-(fatty) acid ligase